LALRPNVDAKLLSQLLPASTRGEVTTRDLESALADQVYAGYLGSQTSALNRLNQHDELHIPDGFSFQGVASLSQEMIERFERARPQSFGQARKVPGITPAALSNLLLHLTARHHESTLGRL
jgi:tRNA uridine 5-carboxymethylaminomethyl modification enzyme